MNYTIYFGDNCLTLKPSHSHNFEAELRSPLNTPPNTPSSSLQNPLHYSLTSTPPSLQTNTAPAHLAELSEFTFAKIVEKIDIYKNVSVECHNINKSFCELCSNFKIAIAAGGVVQNQNNETLMIERFERWDLPKGHLEEGETLEECALREVREETGVTELQLGEKIGTTYHTYINNGAPTLKVTHWWRMQSCSTEALTPQSEEGIATAKWLTQSEINSAIEGSFPNIRDVMRAMLNEL